MRLHPFHHPDTIREMIATHHDATKTVVHPGEIIQSQRDAQTGFARFNGFLADHIVGLAGTMVFFYVLSILLFVWPLYETYIAGTGAFDPYPYAFLFFILGGIMQSLFVPTVMVSQNRASERAAIKEEADHQSQTRLYDVNDEQLALLKELKQLIAQLKVTSGERQA